MNDPDAVTGCELTLAGVNVLLIEDDISLLRAIGGGLIRMGAEVATAMDGQAGLEAFMRSRPDIVVTDIVMPEREGVETIMAMKAVSPDTPILAISGGGRVGSDEFLALAIRLGADDALAKPFRTADLVARMRRLLTAGS